MDCRLVKLKMSGASAQRVGSSISCSSLFTGAPARIWDAQGGHRAREIVDQLVDLVNSVWDKRAELQPDTTTHRRLQPLELFQLLPRTNCKQCGEETCFNFALKVAAAQRELSQCAPLYTQACWEAQRSQLESLVATRWPAL